MHRLRKLRTTSELAAFETSADKRATVYFEGIHSLFVNERDKRRHPLSHVKDAFVHDKFESVNMQANNVMTLCAQAFDELKLESDKKDDQADESLRKEREEDRKQRQEMARSMTEAEWQQHCEKFKAKLNPKASSDIESFLQATLKSRAPDTGYWIAARPVLSQWMQLSNTAKPILWLTGPPGFGKSSLTALITNELRKVRPTGVAYFSCASSQSDRQTVLSILSTLVYQLVRQDVEHTGVAHFDIDNQCVAA